MRAIITTLTALVLTALLAPGAAASPRPLVCFTYNEDALTNACITVDDRQTVVDVPNADGPDIPVCVIGDVCVYVPGPGSTPTPVPKPYFDGYVEVTVACGLLGSACHADLPHVMSYHPWPL